MVITGKVTDQTIAKNIDGKNNVRILQVEITDKEDVQTIQAVYFGGEDNAPVIGSTVYILQISPAFKIVIGVDDGIVPTVNAGERKLYSSENGVIKAFLYLLSSGQMHLNGTGDFAVRFNALEAGFNELKNDFNAHSHPTAPTGPVSPPSVPSTASIATAKINSIEVPS